METNFNRDRRNNDLDFNKILINEKLCILVNEIILSIPEVREGLEESFD